MKFPIFHFLHNCMNYETLMKIILPAWKDLRKSGSMSSGIKRVGVMLILDLSVSYDQIS